MTIYIFSLCVYCESTLSFMESVSPAGFSCLLLNHKSPATLPTSQHISACCNIFYSGVCSDSAAVFAGSSASTCVGGASTSMCEGTWSAYQSTYVSVAQKGIKTIWKETKSGVSLPRMTKFTRSRMGWLTETWHMHLAMTSRLDVWIVRVRDQLNCQKAMRRRKTWRELSNICQLMVVTSQVFHQRKVLRKTQWVTE